MNIAYRDGLRRLLPAAAPRVGPVIFRVCAWNWCPIREEGRQNSGSGDSASTGVLFSACNHHVHLIFNVHFTITISKATAMTIFENSTASRIFRPTNRCSPPLSSHFCLPSSCMLHVVNSSLVSGNVPGLWKTASVTPLFKGGNQDDPNNFRPISILSVVGKLCERIVANQLVAYLSECNVLCPNQHGFRPGHSTESAMLYAVNILTSNIDRGLVTLLTTTDTSKAFDSVQHSRLLEKLGWYGIDTHWFRDWLEGRSQRVVGSNIPLPVTHGVVQGSILGRDIVYVVYQ